MGTCLVATQGFWRREGRRKLKLLFPLIKPRND